ncbi:MULTISPECIES: ABC transporter ATP-binding protein [unclassified Actinopolyspora]|uniref:ATP-binding cassette domain-containing protein n=1 Tax=unclassified Actinopolyspora TaxID=2639451 RepID=UPI0013F6812B|nr:ABC transporter ATP-binding protein [Actinopolyspora sp. BKK2]NHE76633.1 ABC transporter ATP-binding protein [Actinopolyspora sp. BKK1]
MTPDAEHAAVRAHGLTKRFGENLAVADIDLSMAHGEVLALLGPNGAGKTTTAELCEGFLSPDHGQVRVLGLDPVAQGPRLRPRIGVMPQGGGAYPGVRAEEMLRLIASCCAAPLDPAWLLETLGLNEVRSTQYKRLSGGQQQRLSLACALVGRPELVFLDEPTAGMDAHARNLVWELIAALRSDGVGVLLTTHLMDEAETLADRVVIVDHGRVLADGTPAELTAGEERLRELHFRSRPKLDLDLLLAALPEDCAAWETRPGQYLVRGEIDPQTISTVASWCAQHGALADELRLGRRSLEDVFLDLTGRELRA